MSKTVLAARRIFDGVAQELYPGLVIVENHRITAVIRQEVKASESADHFFDERFILSPAFIDAHGHSDISLLAMPGAQGKIAQGIAFEISGNCGLSPFPLSKANCQHLTELYQNYRIPLDWFDYTSYLQSVQKRACALELFPLVGHNTLRAWANGYEKRPLTTGVLQTMQDKLRKELQAGARGLSLGLLYVPGCFADTNEIIALLQVVAEQNKICTVHLRSESDRLEEALQEILSASRQAGLKKLHLSHLKTARAENFHKISALMQALDSPDLRVTGDVYCYDASMTQLSVLLPEPFDQYDDIKIMQLLQDQKVFQQLNSALQRERAPEYWQKVRLIAASGPFTEYCGELLSSIAERLGITPETLCLEIIRHDAAGARAAFHTLSQKNMELLAAHCRVVPGSDESARDCTSKFGSSHPRGFGNHAAYFALRRRQGAGLPEVLREMSTYPAEIFDLPQIGMIQPSIRSVFTVINEAEFIPYSSYTDAHKLCGGAQVIRL